MYIQNVKDYFDQFTKEVRDMPGLQDLYVSEIDENANPVYAAYRMNENFLDQLFEEKQHGQ